MMERNAAISVTAIVDLPAEPVNASTIAPTIRANLTNAARMRTALSLGPRCVKIIS